MLIFLHFGNKYTYKHIISFIGITLACDRTNWFCTCCHSTHAEVSNSNLQTINIMVHIKMATPPPSPTLSVIESSS